MPFIAVRDFGPIAHADVDLKPLTVLIGSNNTGKSYLALVLYAISQAISGTHYHRFGALQSRGWLTHFAVDKDSVRKLKKVVGDVNNPLPEVERILSGQAELRELPPKVGQWLRNESRTWADVLGRHVEYEMRRCFGSSLSQLGRRGRQTEQSDFEIGIRDESAGLSWGIRCRNNDIVTNEWKPDLSRASTRMTESRILPVANLPSDERKSLVYELTTYYMEFLLRSYSAPSHYMPASRSGILQGHKTLASLIIGRASSAWIESTEVERLPGVITDLIQALLVLDSGRAAQGKIGTIVEFLESNIVAGSVDVRKQLAYPELKYHNEAGEFHLHEVSSMVSEVAPVVLYLKYLVRAGHLFIIEEPESHLDPANQRLLARAIAMLVNAGVRVLVTTHSDIFLNQINNLMQVSSLDSRRRLRMGYKAKEVLSPSDVSAYVFQPRADGTQVERLPVDSEYGISTESFDAVHRALYDESIEMEHAG